MRMCMDRLSKNELHGQKLVVTLPTKSALAQFESQQKTRPIPAPTMAPRGQAPMGGPMGGMMGPGGPGNNNFAPQQPQNNPPRMMMMGQPNGPPGFRAPHMPQNMGGPPMPNQCPPPRMQVAKNFLLLSIPSIYIFFFSLMLSIFGKSSFYLVRLADFI